jgi:hypothetical protein
VQQDAIFISIKRSKMLRHNDPARPRQLPTPATGGAAAGEPCEST